MKVIRVKRENREQRRAERLSRDIKVSCYIEAIKEERKERFYINSNRGIEQ